MNKLHLELNNYKNHLSRHSQIYFLAGNELNAKEYQVITRLLNFDWINPDTKVTEIIQYLNNSCKLEIKKTLLPQIKKWVTIQHVKIIFIRAMSRILLRDENLEMENLPIQKAAILFYLGAILSQQPK